MKNYFFLCYLIISVCSNAVSQSASVSMPLFNDGTSINIQHFITKNINRSFAYRSNFNRPFCYEMAFIKFNIDKEGRVDSVVNSDGADTAFCNAITNALFLSNGFWKPSVINKKQVNSKPFILPVFIKYSSNCGATKPGFYEAEIWHIMQSFYKGTVFNNQYNFHIDCYLLMPIIDYAIVDGRTPEN